MKISDFTPVQRVVFKLSRGIRLDSRTKFSVPITIPRPDGIVWGTQSHTESSYVAQLQFEGRLLGWSPGVAPRDVCLVAGRRSGKTLLAAALATEEMAGRVASYEGTTPLCSLMVSADQALADALFDVTIDVMRESPLLGPRLANNRQGCVRFQTDADIARAGPWVGSRRQASASLVVKALSSWTTMNGLQAAFVGMEHPDGMLSDQASRVLRAVEPSLQVMGGSLFMTGTPGPRSFLRTRYERGLGVRLRIPTWELRPDISLDLLTAEYQRDQVQFWSEWGACFVETRTCVLGIPEVVLMPRLRRMAGTRCGSAPPVFRSVTAAELIEEARAARAGEKDGHDLAVDAFREKLRATGKGPAERLGPHPWITDVPPRRSS